MQRLKSSATACLFSFRFHFTYVAIGPETPLQTQVPITETVTMSMCTLGEMKCLAGLILRHDASIHSDPRQSAAGGATGTSACSGVIVIVIGWATTYKEVL